ncbi:DUF2470 domain-containing protein [Actinacidiphila acidipaludis]|uniref:DUF2470 domain-containing protein n=1 Tax=Actinacidiphila acidipaludis TaxID=2873382 RepID=A0ABS7QMP2_9ACTN|nr:DUF2470 domain-containing protein [Streptomyces acidipaludis]MBY8883064.1 DUF2470 domain-containing protein [Streptomyces acidipaludis]
MSTTRTAAACEPTAAERVRSILEVADSAGVTANGAHEDVMAGVAAEFGTAFRLRVPADSRTAAEAVCAPPVGVPAVLEWTDLSPVPVRDRVRARVRIAARLHAPEPAPADSVRLRVDVRQVALSGGGTTRLVDRRELTAARPDPVAAAEARLLTHLAQDHQEHIEALARLLTVRHMLGVTRITPLALDRYGIVLRLDRARGHRDVRIPFACPLSDPDELGHRIHALLAHAHRLRRPA